MNRFEFLAGRRIRAEVTGAEDAAPPTDDPARAASLERARSLLTSLRDASDPALRGAAVVAASRLGTSAGADARLRESLIGDLARDPRARTARAMADGLERLADPSTIAFLHRAARDEGWPCAVRVSLAMTLPAAGADAGAEALQALLPALIDPDRTDCAAHVSMGATLALGEVGGATARGVLEALWRRRDARPDIRAMAVTAMAWQGQDERPNLLEALRAPEAELRRSAAMGLGVLDWRTPAERALRDLEARVRRRGTPYTEAEQDLSRRLATTVAAQREAQEPAVTETVKRLGVAMEFDRDRFVQAMATISLGRIGGATNSTLAHRLLDRAVARRRPVLREYGLLALALARAPSAFEAAHAVVVRPDEAPTTRGAAAIALGLLGDARGRAPLRDAMAVESHPTLRGYDALALGLLGDRGSIQAIRAMVDHGRSPYAVSYAALGLALMGQHADAAVLLRRLSATSDDLVGGNLVHALRILGSRRTIDDLAMIARDPARPGRVHATVALGYATTPADELPRRLALARGFNYLLTSGPLLAYFYDI